MGDLPVTILPENPRKGFFKHNWDDKELKKWMSTAQTFQEAHINDNGNTRAFGAERNQPNEVLLRLCILNYGFRNVSYLFILQFI